MPDDDESVFLSVWRKALDEYKNAVAAYRDAYEAFSRRVRGLKVDSTEAAFEAEQHAAKRLLEARRFLRGIDRRRAHSSGDSAKKHTRRSEDLES
jgi:hypothetical protein